MASPARTTVVATCDGKPAKVMIEEARGAPLAITVRFDGADREIDLSGLPVRVTFLSTVRLWCGCPGLEVQIGGAEHWTTFAGQENRQYSFMIRLRGETVEIR
ncbi:MAG: hypothetical protein ACOY4G_01885 [Pseudomonadota bacterium]